MLHRQNLNYIFSTIVFDLLGTLIAFSLACQAFTHTHRISVSVPFAISLVAMGVWGTVFFVLSVYDPARNFRAVDEFQNAIVATAVSLLVFTGVVFFTYHNLSRFVMLYFFTIDLALILGWRVIARIVFRLVGGRKYRACRVLIVGANGVGQQTSKQLQSYSGPNLTIVGYVDAQTDEQVEVDFPILGTLDDICDVVKQHEIDEVIIALPYHWYSKLDQIVVDLQTLPVQVRVVPNYYNLALYRATVENFGGVPFINLRDPALSPYQRIVKRAFDLIVGTIATVVALPIMGVIAIAIKLDSPGPVFFNQTRVGENGRLFTMYKFRSMVVNADKLQAQVMQYDKDGNPVHKIKEDPRVTRVGKFIRKTSLDELPQLFNVLQGTMTLVGPRPELPWLVDQYESWQCKRFAVPQGITGWWQITGRDEKLMHLHTEDDLYYIQNYSLLLDLLILWKTIGVVLKRKGAF